MPVFYRYIRDSKLRDIAEAGQEEPNNRFIRYGDGPSSLPDKAREGAIWGFHFPDPERCDDGIRQTSPVCHDVREMVAQSERLHLVKITMPSSEGLFVCDTAVFATVRNVNADEAETQAYKDKASHAYTLYWESLIPFDQYNAGDYKEPEVVSFEAIPVSCMEIIHTTEEFVPAHKIPGTPEYQAAQDAMTRLMDSLWEQPQP